VNDYFKHLDGEKPGTVYDMVLNVCGAAADWKPMLYHTEGNQNSAPRIARHQSQHAAQKNVSYKSIT